MIEQQTQALTRTDRISGLRTLLVELRVAVTPARIRIIGCASIALTINAKRAATIYIEGPFNPRRTPARRSARLAAGSDQRHRQGLPSHRLRRPHGRTGHRP